MSQALVNPHLLRWARERAHLPLDVVAKRVGTRPESVSSWEVGDHKPTFKQAQNFAHAVHIPFGYLFLPEPPVETLPIPDLRTVGNSRLTAPTPEFRDLIADVLRKWNWYRDYLREQQQEPVAYVGAFTRNNRPEDVAANITETLRIDRELRESCRSWEEFLSRLIIRAEDAGVWVMRNGVVGNNTHRPLTVDEFRGFALCHPLAPLVFINGSDAKAAQIFTLAHELAHLWIGESGISNLSLVASADEVGNDIERFCNKVASQVLVPQESFLEAWQPTDDLSRNADLLARHFRVSTVVISRRAYDLGFISRDDHWNYYESQKARWTRDDGDRGGGGDFYRTLKVRNGARFSRAVLGSAFEGQLLYRDAAALLGVKVGNLDKFAAELKVR